ncbi:hypothetical protein [Runella slithyformis]|uniref:Uncharacterized protein n=1 Tax=Runella slithyformis (strain ATCC 29530 / DSM 19594 / LMG 11500 / NCIMB 11436 / LSU 4) TaxID=761193 RepID=A0A7U4E736_RUNSL|nr:hypothetical protein [Runella slithyformis]AEI50246.1 hypothetical protein Runsl_3889 [Runella slithyformis DSM 19594]
MIQELPNEARTEHLTIVLVLIAISDNGKAKIKIEHLMKETRITNRKRFFIYLKDLEFWNIISRNQGLFRLQNITVKEPYRLQNVTHLRNVKETDRLQNVTHLKDVKESDRLQNVTCMKDSYRLQNVTCPDQKRLQNVTNPEGHSLNVDNSVTHLNTELYEEQKPLSHVRASRRHTRAGTELVNLLTLKEEKRGLGKKEENQRTFAQSEIASFEDFKAVFSGPEYSRYNLREYYNKLKYWQDTNGQPRTSKNWTATARSIMRKDWDKVNQPPQAKYR